jgi:hypothetical protein
MIANYRNASSGLYGYKGEIKTQVRYMSGPDRKIDFYPGEGVFSALTGKTVGDEDIAGGGNNINYIGILDEGELVKNVPYTGAVLLTYNANPSVNGDDEKGYVLSYQGAALARAAGASPAQSRAALGGLPASYPIGRHDLQNARAAGTAGSPGAGSRAVGSPGTEARESQP